MANEQRAPIPPPRWKKLARLAAGKRLIDQVVILVIHVINILF